MDNINIPSEDVNKIWDTVSDEYKESLLKIYNDAHVHHNSELIDILNTIFGGKIRNMYESVYEFVPGDIVKYKSTLPDYFDKDMRFEVLYYDDMLNNLIRVSTYYGNYRTINANNLERIKL